jgi:dipeptidyl aminopeptidase/acylaminoacyl peptidase
MPTLPYGSWPSPIEAAEVAASSPRIDGARFVGEHIWWSESLPAERGRTAILGASMGGDDAAPEILLPAPWSARSRVHEYGGGAWAVTAEGSLVFVEHSDQRVWLMVKGTEPEPLTPADTRARFGDLVCTGDRLFAVRETHEDGAAAPLRDIVSIALDGSGIHVLAAGRGFYAAPAPSPDGRLLAYVAWDHPDMPWDRTDLQIVPLGTEAGPQEPTMIAGGPGVSALQPEWSGDALVYASDASGRWQLERRRVDGDGTGEERHLTSGDADTGGPLWNLGARWYAPLTDGRILAVRTHGRDTLTIRSRDGMDERALDVPISAQVLVRDVRGTRALVTGAGATAPMGLWLVDVDDPDATRAVRGGALPRDEAWYPRARAMTFTGPSGPVHAFDYPPTNPGTSAPEGERAPYVVTVHGGPTAHVAGEVSGAVAYLTSRGIGVLDVNYGGSTGYGRAYRERLKGQWGIVDVQDVVAAASGLADAGLADRTRMAIKGGSAGGWTVLAALTGTDAFGAGISRYGVGDLRALAADTHDFEARYLDGLVGPLPDAEQVYIERSPLSHMDGLNAPVLLLQGGEDRVVPPAQAEALRDALAARGIPHALVMYPDEAHGFRQAATIVHALESELSFLGQVFGFETPGVPRLPLER